MDDLDQLTDLAAAYEPCMSLYVDQDSRSVELILDTSVSTYGEWINGEGANICLLRCRETNRVVGVRLPLLHEKLAVFHRGPLRVNDGFKKAP